MISRFRSVAWVALPLAAAMLVSCGTPDVEEQPIILEDCVGNCGGRTYVFDVISLEGADENGHVRGWDFDGFNSTKNDADGCYTEDFTSPEGETGIDNQIANLLPLVIEETGEALPALIRNSINEGGLLILAELVGASSLVENDAVGMAFRRGTGTPMLGTDGKLLPHQTYFTHEEPWLGGFSGATIREGRLTGGPFDFRLAVVVFGVEYELPLRQARFDFMLSADGMTIDGILGGLIHADDIIAGVADRIVVDETGNQIRAIVPLLTDIRNEETGRCELISVVATVQGIPGYIFKPEP
jgi:hypothetical protein